MGQGFLDTIARLRAARAGIPSDLLATQTDLARQQAAEGSVKLNLMRALLMQSQPYREYLATHPGSGADVGLTGPPVPSAASLLTGGRTGISDRVGLVRNAAAGRTAGMPADLPAKVQLPEEAEMALRGAQATNAEAEADLLRSVLGLVMPGGAGAGRLPPAAAAPSGPAGTLAPPPAVGPAPGALTTPLRPGPDTLGVPPPKLTAGPLTMTLGAEPPTEQVRMALGDLANSDPKAAEIVNRLGNAAIQDPYVAGKIRDLMAQSKNLPGQQGTIRRGQSSLFGIEMMRQPRNPGMKAPIDYLDDALMGGARAGGVLGTLAAGAARIGTKLGINEDRLVSAANEQLPANAPPADRLEWENRKWSLGILRTAFGQVNNIMRALGDVGNLGEQEKRDLVQAFMPEYGRDSSDAAEAKLQAAQQIITSILASASEGMTRAQVRALINEKLGTGFTGVAGPRDAEPADLSALLSGAGASPAAPGAVPRVATPPSTVQDAVKAAQERLFGTAR